jgi:hypothetical protein
MNFKLIRVAVCGLVCAFGAQSVQAIDPIYGFPFGYTLGAQFSLRNRLPAPPYFAIYPPVYYGQRHQRPYGESPYASFPLLGSTPNYSPVPKEVPGVIERNVVNPYSCPTCQESISDVSTARNSAHPRVGGVTIVVNPFAQDHVANNE